jgi:hypothetical protein
MLLCLTRGKIRSGQGKLFSPWGLGYIQDQLSSSTGLVDRLRC